MGAPWTDAELVLAILCSHIYALQQSSFVFNNYFTAATTCTPRAPRW